MKSSRLLILRVNEETGQETDGLFRDGAVKFLVTWKSGGCGNEVIITRIRLNEEWKNEVLPGKPKFMNQRVPIMIPGKFILRATIQGSGTEGGVEEQWLSR